ncbi:class I SAM-dependent methyltransferase [Novipirellula maiorica]|uniref:class I SAM-dependent methyltransferase n=1 Tax=Novipirellula maiorica TaxID=1265734 RepID=UPI001360B651|nr:class I SAM-dependent methyltransferase [Rhodopirellula maiorica]
MKANKESVASFYDEFSKRLLNDYIRGNRRFNAAVELASSALSGRSGKILDIGCGIGVSSNACVELPGQYVVQGVDISPRNIEIANRLFARDRLTYEVSDMSKPLESGPFDALLLIDMYEHIPRSDWPGFNRVLSTHLAPGGIIILTTPSPLHQEYLRQEKPEGLQIVDETVEVADVIQLMQDTGTTLKHYSLETIWNTNDYVHLVLEHDPKHLPAKKKSNGVGMGRRIGRKFRDGVVTALSTDSESARRKFVEQRLGVGWE